MPKLNPDYPNYHDVTSHLAARYDLKVVHGHGCRAPALHITTKTASYAIR